MKYRLFDWMKTHLFWTVIIILISIGIISFGFPLIINFSFVDKGIPVKWDASNYLLFYGSFLAFFGTVFLGAVALVQNLNNIDATKKANEINIINKIISLESSRIENTVRIIDEYTGLCDYSNITKMMIDNMLKSEKAIAQNMSIFTELNSHKKKLNNLVFTARRVYCSYANEDIDSQFINALNELYEKTKIILDYFITEISLNQNNQSTYFDKEEYKLYDKSFSDFVEKKEALYKKIYNKLDIVLYSDKTLHEIKKMYEQ